MIQQITPIPRKFARHGDTSTDLAQVRRIQHNLQARRTSSSKPEIGLLWSGATPGPFIVPITRWIE